MGLVALNVVTYWLFSEISSQQTVNNKYLDFTQRRLDNEWSIDTNEHVIVASCGDEFFRNIKQFERTVWESNPKDTDSPNELTIDDEYYQSVWKVDDNMDVLGTIKNQTDTLNSRTCIIYKVCTQWTIAGLMKKIEYQYFFSDSPTDFHVMYYNGQMEASAPTYFWLFGFWIETTGQITPFD